jgi:catechol-2,3-dioxygenase
MHPTHIFETSLYSTNLERSENFYSNILNLQLVTKKEGRHLFYKLDSGKLLIFNPEQTKIDNGKVPPHGATGSIHIAFGIKGEEYEQWKKYLQEKGVEIEKEVEWED